VPAEHEILLHQSDYLLIIDHRMKVPPIFDHRPANQCLPSMKSCYMSPTACLA